MSKHTYPRLGRTSPLKRGLCSCCKTPAIARVDIEVSYMRGDDEVFKVCAKHELLVKNGAFQALFDLAAVEKRARQAQHKPRQSREARALEQDADREMLGADAEYFGLTNIGNK